MKFVFACRYTLNDMSSTWGMKLNGIGRFITNQQNIYRVTPVHYLQKAEKKT